MRYFISVDVDDEGVKENIITFTEEVEQYGDIKTVRPENLHITLLFLGNRSQGDVNEIKERFISSCEDIRVSEFECSVSGVGVFPHMKYINTVWVGVKPGETFEELHMNFSEVTDGENEDDFVPHITVGRVRGIGGEEKRELQAMIEQYEKDFGTFQVTDVRLKESELGEDGPTYRDVEVWSL